MSNSTGRQNLSVSLRRGGNVDDDKVFQGLQKKQRCKLCEQEFFVDSLPGAISYNSVLKLRQKYVVVVVATSRNVTHSNHTVLHVQMGKRGTFSIAFPQISKGEVVCLLLPILR